MYVPADGHRPVGYRSAISKERNMLKSVILQWIAFFAYLWFVNVVVGGMFAPA